MPTKSERDRLRERLQRTPYLLIDCQTKTAKLATEDEMRKKVGGGTHFIMDARGAFDGLSGLAGDKEQFSLTEIAKIAGVEYHAGHFWMREGVLSPSIRPPQGSGRGRGPIFSFCDAVAAGILGTLRRQGIELETAQTVVPLFSGDGRQNKKRSARKGLASKRT